MGQGDNQARSSYNRRKVNILKKKRQIKRNRKYVHFTAHGMKPAVTSKHKPSKKKQRKDEQRLRTWAQGEKDKLLKFGLITEMDIAKIKEEDSVDEAAAEMEE